MATIIHQNLFSWEDVETSSDLYRLQLALTFLPDERLVRRLESKRGRGRDTYPIRAMWNAVVAGIVLQHPTVESLLRELRRNGELRAVCGFNTIHASQAVPTPWAMSRFMKNVIAEEALVNTMFEDLVERSRELLPDLGSELAFDGKALESHSTGRKRRDTGIASDPDADWGIKSYRGIDKGGKPWEKIKRWFGYQLHLIVDVNYELPVAYEVKRASTNESGRLLPMVKSLKQRHPAIVEHCRTLMADRGLDCSRINRDLLDEHSIKPVIDTRAMWKDEKAEQGRDLDREITRSLYPDRTDTIVYTERGSVRCICPVSGEETPMAFWGFEPNRGTLKYRCPAAAHGTHCPGRSQCELQAKGQPGSYGRIVRVPLETDRRIFTPIPRDTPAWDRSYAKRTAVERVNSRVAGSFGFDHHTIRGLGKMRVRAGLALAVMLAMAVGFISHGKPELMRSLVGNTRAVRQAA
ncbi:MAG: transposase [Acidimicrobiia bacterium]